MSDIYKDTKARLTESSLSFINAYISAPVKKKRKSKGRTPDAVRSKKSYDHRKATDPLFKEKERERNAKKREAMKKDPIRYEKYLEACRRSKARKKERDAA